MLSDIFTLILDTVFTLYILVVFLRFLFPLIGVDFYNPISQFVLKATNPILTPLRQIIPIRKNIDSVSLLFIIFLQVIEICLIQLIHVGAISSLLDIVEISIIKLTSMAFNFYFFAVIGQIILSWVAPYNNNPAVSILYQITEPVLRPARKLIPPVGGLDFSPVIVVLAIQILDRIITGAILPQLFYFLNSVLN